MEADGFKFSCFRVRGIIRAAWLECFVNPVPRSSLDRLATYPFGLGRKVHNRVKVVRDILRCYMFITIDGPLTTRDSIPFECSM